MSFHLLGNRRSALASSSSTPVATEIVNPVKDDFPEALTYRYNDNSAWVPAAKTHDEAVDLAKHAYPELRGIRRDRITFHTTGKSSIACITPAAWQLVVRRLPPYHVVDVRIRDPVEDLPEEEGRGGVAVAAGRDAELPEYYPYMAGAAGYAYIIPKEKEEQIFTSRQQQQQQQPQSQQQQTRNAEDGGNRLRRVFSFVRGD